MSFTRSLDTPHGAPYLGGRGDAWLSDDRGGTPIRVLVVDEHPAACALVREVLAGQSPFGIVGEAYSGTDAWEQVAALGPDLVLLNVELPGMGGLAAAQGIAERAPGVLVVMIGHYTEMEYSQAAIAVGALAYIPRRELTAERLVEALDPEGRA